MSNITRREALSLGIGALSFGVMAMIADKHSDALAASELPTTMKYRTVSGRYAFDSAGDYGTYKRVTDVNGYTRPVYCVEPELGGWDVVNWVVSDSGVSADLRTVLWFGCDGPGFDASMWPDTWDGKPWDYGRYFLVTHVLLSEMYRSRSQAWQGNNQATGQPVGPPPASYGPYQWYVNKVVGSGGLLSKMKAKASDIPSGFKVFFLNRVKQGSSAPAGYDWSAAIAGEYQTMVSFDYSTGYVQIQKDLTF